MKIGILETGEAPEALRDQGSYPSMFMRLLGGHGFTFESYPVLHMRFPASVVECDGWLITGSRFGVYEDHAFIPPLEDFIRKAMAEGVGVVGICFGHQIMAQALGGNVAKFPGGWVAGPTEYTFEDETLTLNAWHQDQVLTPPPAARTLASNAGCAYAALAYGENGLSIQAHPEYDDTFIAGLIEHRGRGVVPADLLTKAQSALGQGQRDSARIGERIAEFLKTTHARRASLRSPA
jgi:GMP synthase-like glutamine amidotransferase